MEAPDEFEQGSVGKWRRRPAKPVTVLKGSAYPIPYPVKGRSENGIYGHSRFCNTDFDDKLACLNLSGV
jgi:hypothetical protein